MAVIEEGELARAGVPAAEVERQLDIFRNPPGFAELDRHCAIGDGIERVADEADDLAAYERARAAGRLTKFVPASGAASRMFQALLALRESRCTPATLATLGEAGDGNAAIVAATVEGLHRLPFYPELSAELERRAVDLAAAVQSGELAPIIDAMVDAEGLACADMPKGLLPFHRYGATARTAFEEHLREAVDLVRDDEGVARLHFTVAEEHEERFERALKAVRGDIEAGGAVRLEVGFSTQAHSTDTIAVDLDDQPFRNAEGKLVFRPAGHGALLGNLAASGADVALIQNIDNIQPAGRRAASVGWKKILIGRLVRLDEERASALRSTGAARLRELCQVLGLPHSQIAGGDLAQHCRRPLRVCGVVRNTGEPGGGPFWIRRPDGISRQIVESAQVDRGDAEQRRIFNAATHFNPVLLACALRDADGRIFSLDDFVDQRAVFISRKSYQGRDLKALERPGLWNGAMAEWGSVFLEIGGEAFTPVKTIADLLRAEHQVGA